VTELETRIGRGDIDPVYLLVGDEPLLGQRIVAALIEQVVTPATRAFNLDVFEAKAAGATAVINAARTVPMLGKRRLVIVRDVDGLGAEGLAALAPYLADPSPHTVLVLSCLKVDGRLKFFQLARKQRMLHVLEAPRQLVPWIREEAQRRGARLEPDAARRLADVVGGDLGRLASSLEQLSLYVGDDRAIAAADVDELVAETRERNVFELTNAVGQGDRERALRAVARLAEQRESAVGVAMMLARHVRQLALAKELVDARTPDAALPGLLGAPPFAVDRLLAQARRFTLARLLRALRLVAKADVDLKGPVKGALGERIVLERLVGDLVALAAVSPSSKPGPASGPGPATSRRSDHPARPGGG
jgi:DNA polymerase III subunit delta